MVSLFFLLKAPAAGSKPSSRDLPGSGVSCKNCGPSPAPGPSSEKDLERRRWRGSVFEYFGNCRCRRGQGDQCHEIRQDITTAKLLRHPNVVCLDEQGRRGVDTQLIEVAGTGRAAALSMQCAPAPSVLMLSQC